MTPERIVVSCEHGGNRVPAAWTQHFRGHEVLLRSHEGHDIGALELARDVARALRAPLHSSTVTRLLVDLNRSLDNSSLFSTITKRLSVEEKERLLARHWHPYREAVERRIEAKQRGNRSVLHLSVHTFTPVFAGKRRDVDVGILFDPKREAEAALASRWLADLGTRCPDLVVRRNAPYRGWSDGLTTAMRAKHPESLYLGLELEVSQRFPEGDAMAWRQVRRELCTSLATILGAGPGALVP